MRYTRYNYRRGNNNRRNNKNNMGFLFLGVLCILLAVVVGTMLRPLIFGDAYKNAEGGENDNKIGVEDSNKEKEKDSGKENTEKEDEQKEKETIAKKDEEDTKGNLKELFMIQCGLYSKKEGAETVLNKIPSNYNKFISEEDKKYRVIAGIYDDEISKKKIEELEKNDIECVRIKSGFDSKDKEKVEMYSILNGYIDILNKLEENDVKSIKTEDFKKWTKELDLKNESEEVKEIKKHINELPKELDKKGAEKSLDYIYKILIKYRV